MGKLKKLGKLNILVFSWRDSRHPLAGGAEQVMHEHAKGWVTAGHKVFFFSAYFKGAKKEEILGGVKITRRGVQLLGVQILGFFWYLFGNHPKFELVVDQFHGIPFFTPLYVRTKKLAVIQEVAKEVWLMNHLPKPFNWIIGLVGYLFEPFIFLFYRKVPFMTASASTKRDLIDFGIPEDNINIVPHGVVLPDTRYPILDTKNKTKTIAFLGALAKDKGIEEAIKCFAILNKKGEFNFWVIGKGGRTYLPELRKMAKRLRLGKRITFWGFVEEKKKFELLSRAHLLVNPSAREGWGLVNIEANAMTTPVVAYNSPGLVDSVKDGVSGVICGQNTPEQMAKEILRLLSNKASYEKLREGAIKWAKSFSWEKSRKESLMLVDRIVR